LSAGLATPILQYVKHLAALLGVGVLCATSWAAERSVVRKVDFDYVVHPVSAYRILKAIDEAEAARDDLVLIRLDTPGGDVASLGKIVRRMLNAKVPVVVWVGPAGAHAASAGFLILTAADVAAMAPGTRTGAASTVYATGESTEGDVLLKKANEDMAALCRSIANRRGRNVEACEEAVFSAKAFEETVALERGLIDFIAASEEEVLERLDGREITLFDGTVVELHTADAEFATTEFSFQQEFMEFLATPVVAFLLFAGGMLGLYIEFTHPGVVFPGVVGALCMLLFILSARALPISIVGLLLILLAAVMFILEVKVVSYGMLTLGGAISLIIGSLMLIDGPIPEMRVPLGVVLPVSIAMTLVIAGVLRLALNARRARVATGVEGLCGEIGSVTVALEPRGKVHVHGEIWDAVSTQGSLPRGERVRVVEVEDMLLKVAPADGRAEGS